MNNDIKTDTGKMGNYGPQSKALSTAMEQARKSNETSKKFLAEYDKWFSQLNKKV